MTTFADVADVPHHDAASWRFHRRTATFEGAE
jgi:hypothetical protein